MKQRINAEENVREKEFRSTSFDGFVAGPNGETVFGAINGRTNPRPVEATTFSSGVAGLHYQKNENDEPPGRTTDDCHISSTPLLQSVHSMTIEELNSLPESEAIAELARCCGSSLWMSRMISVRPFASNEECFRNADTVWWSLSEKDWREAFAHHPAIGDIENLRKKFVSTAQWASTEQSGAMSASEETLKALAEGNKHYEEQFGYIFIISATGKSAEEMLHILNSRLPNSPDEEITIAAAEQAKITRLRLERLLNNS